MPRSRTSVRRRRSRRRRRRTPGPRRRPPSAPPVVLRAGPWPRHPRPRRRPLALGVPDGRVPSVSRSPGETAPPSKRVATSFSATLTRSDLRNESSRPRRAQRSPPASRSEAEETGCWCPASPLYRTVAYVGSSRQKFAMNVVRLLPALRQDAVQRRSVEDQQPVRPRGATQASVPLLATVWSKMIVGPPTDASRNVTVDASGAAATPSTSPGRCRSVGGPSPRLGVCAHHSTSRSAPPASTTAACQIPCRTPSSAVSDNASIRCVKLKPTAGGRSPSRASSGPPAAGPPGAAGCRQGVVGRAGAPSHSLAANAFVSAFLEKVRSRRAPPIHVPRGPGRARRGSGEQYFASPRVAVVRRGGARALQQRCAGGLVVPQRQARRAAHWRRRRVAVRGVARWSPEARVARIGDL